MSDVLEMVRAANPVSEYSPPPFEELWERVELDNQVGPVARRPRLRDKLRSSAAIVPVLVAITVTLVIAAVALTSLRHAHGSSTVTPTAPRITARNGQIGLLFGAGTSLGAGGLIELVNPNGSGSHFVTGYPCLHQDLGLGCDIHAFAWSPNGTKLAYVAGIPTISGPNDQALYIVGANGQQRRLTACPYCAVVSWSPDGSHIAVEPDTAGRWKRVGRAREWVGARNVWVVNATTGAARRLTDCPPVRPLCWAGEAQWSPSGQAVLFTLVDKGRESLDTSRPDGSHLRTITTIPVPAGAAIAEDPSAQWSPDGREIAFDANNGIYIVNADGTDLKRLVAQGADPAWSPEGTRLVYSTWSPGLAEALTQLWTINADGSDKRLLYRPPVGGVQIWSPDGKQIAFSANAGTYVINANGTGLHRIGPVSAALDWQPVP